MQAQPFYIATPIGELNSPHWKAIMSGPDGYKIVVIALMLRDIALSCNAGGFICHPSGESMLVEEMAAILGVDVMWLRPVLAGPLSRSGFVNGNDDEGWVCGDRVAKVHFSKLERKPKGLLPSVDDEKDKERRREQTRERVRRHRDARKAAQRVLGHEEKSSQKRLQLQKQLLLVSDTERQAIETEAKARALACVAEPSPGILAEFQLAVYAEMIGKEI